MVHTVHLVVLFFYLFIFKVSAFSSVNLNMFIYHS